MFPMLLKQYFLAENNYDFKDKNIRKSNVKLKIDPPSITVTFRC